MTIGAWWARSTALRSVWRSSLVPDGFPRRFPISGWRRWQELVSGGSFLDKSIVKRVQVTLYITAPQYAAFWGLVARVERPRAAQSGGC